ncbi:MAG: mechanosensitive ion channel [Thiolinea sp.]
MSSLYIDLSQSWVIWGAALVIAFPLLVILTGELAHHLEREESKYVSLIRFGQRFIMPQLVLLLITTRILELSHQSVVVKIIETLLWVFIIYAVVTLFNLLVFSESGGRWQIKAPKLLLEVMRIIIMALGIAIVLSKVWGFELGKMMAAFGVGSIVLGLALQDTMSSLFSGFSLISSKQFKEGDWLKVGDHIGRVIQVNWRSVTLLNRDDDVILIPNSDLAKGQFVNFSHPYPHHVERVNFDFSFDDAPHKVKQVLIKAALDTPGILEPVVTKQANPNINFTDGLLHAILAHSIKQRICTAASNDFTFFA